MKSGDLAMVLNDRQVEEYRQNGFVFSRGLFEEEEIALLSRSAKEDHELDRHAYGRDDGEGGKTRLSLWNHPGDNIYGMFARSRRIVDSVERLLEGEVYHYHSKMILKDARVGGAWAWHQDYGYWYQNGVLFPLLTSVMIAVDRATRENGCLQVLQNSHHLGRVDHVLTGDQAGADQERVAEARKRLKLVYCEMEPGDTLFFHCNLLHRSDQNRSNFPRWTLICCYNAARNDPYKESHHPRYTPLAKVEDTAIKEVGLKRFSDGDAEKVEWLDPNEDVSASSLGGEG
jgi:hypothetical protein